MGYIRYLDKMSAMTAIGSQAPSLPGHLEGKGLSNCF